MHFFSKRRAAVCGEGVLTLSSVTPNGVTGKALSAYDDYLRIAADWDVEFARNKRQYGEKIHCRKGCSDCCSQMFQITEL